VDMFLNLKPGAIIDVVATSYPHFDTTAQKIKDFVSDLGYRARVADNFQEQGADSFSANTNEIRAQNLINALKSPDSTVIWALRGGYGATPLIRELDKHDFSSTPKVIIGYSDLTALGLYFTQKYNWKFIHGGMLSWYIAGKQINELTIMKSLLDNSWTKLEYKLVPLNSAARNSYSIAAKVLGGNLSLIQCSLGTKWHIDTKGKILFFEEVGERGYRIDRMLHHLKDADGFEKTIAIIVGDMSCTPENDGSTLCDVAVNHLAQSLNIPVFKSNQFGHGDQNYPLIFNYDAHLRMGDAPSIVFENK